MIQFIEDHRADHGVEPICRMLPIASATFYDHLAMRADPTRLVHQRTADVNALRALLYEHGYVFPVGIRYLDRMTALVEDEASDLPALISPCSEPSSAVNSSIVRSGCAARESPLMSIMAAVQRP
jgi:hypothetical protein